MEVFLTGYCRCLDKSRIVLMEDGEADCEFFSCPHAQSCEIARQIREKLGARPAPEGRNAFPFGEGGTA